MKVHIGVAAVAAASILSGCVTYNVPKVSGQVNINLEKKDLVMLGEFKSSEWAFGIFGYNFFNPTVVRAEQYAIGKAYQAAYEKSGADYVIQPKSKVKYVNLIFFDFAQAEVSAKGARLKE